MLRGEVVRVVWGVWQLCAAAPIARAELGGEPDALTTWALRILGARQIVQGIVLSRTGSRLAHRLGGAVDLVHATSMVVVAVASRRRRAAAVIDGGTALCFAGVELRG
ncbi:hypothetical protein [Microbacterium terrisoli]|jgi:hypothetical protein|uniref:hypothetical protein n=1 Tax=Microbacterium terrisoli TaxID=3242192 RepID=UPI0028054BE8|nr:hypothetical protein [Microbacterium protaetiae]